MRLYVLSYIRILLVGALITANLCIIALLNRRRACRITAMSPINVTRFYVICIPMFSVTRTVMERLHFSAAASRSEMHVTVYNSSFASKLVLLALARFCRNLQIILCRCHC